MNTFKTFIAAMLLLSSMAVFADEEEHISIHEFHLGMTETEWKATEALYDHMGFHDHTKKPRFSVGGQYPLNEPTAGVGILAGLQSWSTDGKEGNLYQPIGAMTPKFIPSTGRFNLAKGLSGAIQIRFAAASFDAVKQALHTKYPETKCEDRPVQNAMGAQFTDTLCTYETSTEILTFLRYADSKVINGISLLSVWQIGGYKAMHTNQDAQKKDL